MHVESVKSRECAIVIDDLVGTGGTLSAAKKRLGIMSTDRLYGRFYTRRNRHRFQTNEGDDSKDHEQSRDVQSHFTRTVAHSQRTSLIQYVDVQPHVTQIRSLRSRRASFTSLVINAENHDNLFLSQARKRDGKPRYASLSSLMMVPKSQSNVLHASSSYSFASQHLCKELLEEECTPRPAKRLKCNSFASSVMTAVEENNVCLGPSSTKKRSSRSRRSSFASLVIDEANSSTAQKRRIKNKRRKEARQHQTFEQRAYERAKNTAYRKRARALQTAEQKDIERAKNTAKRKLACQKLTYEECLRRQTIARDKRIKRLRMMTPEELSRQQSAEAARKRSFRKKMGNVIVARPQRRSTSKRAAIPRIMQQTAPLSSAQLFWKSCNDIVWISCEECKRRFFDINISSGTCANCKADRRQISPIIRFSEANSMDPGSVPLELARLSDLEKILISRVHPMMSVYRVKGQQYKYSGHVINFAQDVNKIASVLPFKPADLSAILIVTRIGLQGKKEFRREFVRQALVWLKRHHLYYSHITIDEGNLLELPEDGIPKDISCLQENGVLPVQEDDLEGPPEFLNQNFQVDDFLSVGTVMNVVQPNQQASIRRVLHLEDVDHTTVDLPITHQVINEFSEAGYITMAFPALFPYGKADLRQARLKKIHPSEYFQYLMKYHDGRFAKDSRFRYFAWNSLSRWRALSIGEVYVKNNPQDADLSIQEIRNIVSSGDKRLATCVSFYARNIRGSRAYWYTRLKELIAMVKQLGSPTIFFTLSAADLQWPELYKLLDSSNNLEKMGFQEKRRERARLLNENPLVVAWFFKARVNFFLQKFLLVKFSVVDYWYRFEWQHRGSGHVHGFLWLKDAPDVSEIATNLEARRKVCEYFDRLICTQNPDPDFSKTTQTHPCARVVPVEASLECDEDDYASLVNWVLRHSRCGSYCLRMHKTTKTMVCRFKYPFDVLEKSEIIEEPPSSGIYRYLGCRNDPYVCSHNREVAQTWRANIDISGVITKQAVVNYIGKYAAKSEPASKSFNDILSEIVEDSSHPCQSSKSAVQRLLIKSICERDITAQETCHLLMGYPLMQSSRRFVLMNLSEKNMLSTTVRQTAAADDEESVGTFPSFVKKYMQRPSKFEDISLLNMAMGYYYKGEGWHKYKIPAIVRLIPEIEGDILPNSEKWESFCRQQVLLQHHYRSLPEAKGNFELWSEQYNLLGLGVAENIFPEPLDDDLEDHYGVDDEIDDQVYEEWMLAAGLGTDALHVNDVELGMRDVDVTHNWSNGLCRFPNIHIDAKFVHTLAQSGKVLDNSLLDVSLLVPLSKLSHEQRVTHDLVLKSLKDNTPIQLIVCGGAGTGKSTLIHAIVHSTTEMFGNTKAVRIMAPTGVAAFNVRGATIHHELGISVDRDRSQCCKRLVGEQCARMQEEFKDTKLIIIDEYSMVGRSMFASIDQRCRDVFAKDMPFGGVSIVLVGDMRQLPPVYDSPLYAKGGSLLNKMGGISYSGFQKCVRLTEIYRQAGEENSSFREALLRLSRGESTQEDWSLFLTRDWSILSSEDVNSFRDAIRLFPTKKSVNAYNCIRLAELNRPVVKIKAKHNCSSAAAATSDMAKGLEDILYLSIGARVMLRTNLAIHAGLVNGAMGTIVDIIYSSGYDLQSDLPVTVLVDFDNYHGPEFIQGTKVIPISPQTAHWKDSKGISCQRTQIPLLLSWAITVHKSQGLTLDRVVIDIGESEKLGMTFVALSRTRKLTDMAFNPMFDFERLQDIAKCRGLAARLCEEERLQQLSSISLS